MNPMWFLLPLMAALCALAVWCWTRREPLPPGTCPVCRGRKWVMDRHAVGGPNDEPCPRCAGTGLEPDVSAELAELRVKVAEYEMLLSEIHAGLKNISTEVAKATVCRCEEYRKTTVKHFVETLKPWSHKTFGCGRRTIGITKHIEKELAEIRAKPTDIKEWIDVVILGLDGAWRAGHAPEQIEAALFAKLAENMGRKWPPPVDEDTPTEHIRDGGPADG